ncbi:MAG TPA: hypothetical protein VMM93_06075 [Vicinamibacterales bacterium]|nr:hypothetical protein [Vicinamibacterales bacterium]
MIVTAVAGGLYVLTMAVGLVAEIGRIGFGRLHHVLYFATFAAALAAAWMEFHPGLLVTIAALAGMPVTRPRTIWHPALAACGLVGYVAVVALP